MDIELLFTLASWFGLVWFATSGLFVIIMQAFLPRAWEQIRANPPYGPDWAYNLWYHRDRVYGALMTFSLLLGALAALVAFVFR